jgi:uncharacterized protein
VDVVVSLHDVAPASAVASARWLDVVESFGWRATLLVIPGSWRGAALGDDADFVTWLHTAADRGHELALHGWEHHGVARDGRGPRHRIRRCSGFVLARGCAEFNELDTDEARRRIDAGRRVLSSVGIEPVGFTPPGWLASHDTVAVLRDEGFRYTTTQWAVLDLVGGRTIRMPAISQRPGSRMTLTASRANERVVSAFADRGRSLRIALHPDDLHHEELVAATKRMFTKLAVAGARARTYEELVS